MHQLTYEPRPIPEGAEIVVRQLNGAGMGTIVYRMPNGSFGAMSDPEVGIVNGRHFLAYVEPIKQAKREGRLEDAAAMLTAIIDSFDRDIAEWNVRGDHSRPRATTPPWYYEHLAIVYRKLKRFDDEIRVLQRYAAIEPEYGAWTAARIAKARQFAARVRSL